MPINFLNEIIFASDKPSEAKKIAYKESKGVLRKIAPRLYTTNMVDSPENIVKRNLISILGWRFPGCIISHRSASSLRPTPNGNLFLTYKFTRRITDFPGLTLNVLEGPGHLASDIKLGRKGGCLKCSNLHAEARAENRKGCPQPKLKRGLML